MINRNIIVTIAIVVNSLFLVLLFIMLTHDKKSYHNYRIYKYYVSKVKYYIIMLFIIILIISNIRVIFLPDNTQYTTDDVELSQKITELSHSLSESATELSMIQDDLNKRIEFVTELKKQAEIAENTINLTDEQVNAIRQQLNEGGKVSTILSVFASFVISAFFFAIGILIGRNK